MRKPKLINRLITYLIILIILAVLYFIPDKFLFESRNSLCLHKMILGIECPLCGMTRAAHELMHLRFLSAFQYNFTIYLLSLFIIADVLDFLFHGKKLRVIRKISLISLLSGFGIIYVLRLGFYFGWI
jgi:hypothetical protein